MVVIPTGGADDGPLCNLGHGGGSSACDVDVKYRRALSRGLSIRDARCAERVAAAMTRSQHMDRDHDEGAVCMA